MVRAFPETQHRAQAPSPDPPHDAEHSRRGCTCWRTPATLGHLLCAPGLSSLGYVNRPPAAVNGGEREPASVPQFPSSRALGASCCTPHLEVRAPAAALYTVLPGVVKVPVWPVPGAMGPPWSLSISPHLWTLQDTFLQSPNPSMYLSPAGAHCSPSSHLTPCLCSPLFCE